METQIKQFLESIDYAYFETDLDGVITFANQVLCEALGFTQKELVGIHFDQISDSHRFPEISERFERIRQTGQPEKRVEYHFRRQNGTLSVAEGAVALLKDEAGSPKGYCGLLHDVTDRQQAEEALQHAKESAERELEIGRRIQRNFLPEQLPQLPGWEIAGYFQAAREVAGDFYDAFMLAGGKRLGLVIADVSDKGVGAALFMALFRSLIRAFADQHYALGWMDVLKTDSQSSSGRGSVGRRRALLAPGATALKNAIDLTNNYITRNHGRTNMFATVFFGVLDPATGTLIYINGGHEPPLLIGPQGIKSQLNPTGPAVGLLPGLEFGIEQVDIEPGDMLLSYTDGVIDANSPAGAFYSEERLHALARTPAPTAAALLKNIQKDLYDHIGSADQYDDVTILAVRRDAP